MIIPVYNEEAIIKHTAKTAYNFLEENFERFELIIVDDGSSDSTVKVLENTNAAVISLGKNRGKGGAVKEGISHAGGNYIFFTDGDLPYSLDFILHGKSMLQTCDVVCGSRKGTYPFLRSAASAAYNGIAQKLLKTDIADLQCGIKGFTSSAAKSIFPRCKINGFAFDTEVIFLARQMGFLIDVVNVNMHHRKNSKVNLISDSIEMFRDVLKIKNYFKAGEYDGLEAYSK